MDSTFDKRKALETFGTRSAFAAAIDSFSREVRKAIAKLEQATECPEERTGLTSTLSRLESGLAYMHAGPALRTLRGLRAKVAESGYDSGTVDGELTRLRQQLIALLEDLQGGLGRRLRRLED